jgi:hypothetical protein
LTADTSDCSIWGLATEPEMAQRIWDSSGFYVGIDDPSLSADSAPDGSHWRELYRAALLELDLETLAERVAAVAGARPCPDFVQRRHLERRANRHTRRSVCLERLAGRREAESSKARGFGSLSQNGIESARDTYCARACLTSGSYRGMPYVFLVSSSAQPDQMHSASPLALESCTRLRRAAPLQKPRCVF